jgi:hypothetical protein
METFDFQKIENLENKKQILSNWKKTIESHALNGVGEIPLHGDFLIDIFAAVLGYRRIIENQKEWKILF